MSYLRRSGPLGPVSGPQVPLYVYLILRHELKHAMEPGAQAYRPSHETHPNPQKKCHRHSIYIAVLGFSSPPTDMKPIPVLQALRIHTPPLFSLLLCRFALCSSMLHFRQPTELLRNTGRGRGLVRLRADGHQLRRLCWVRQADERFTWSQWRVSHRYKYLTERASVHKLRNAAASPVCIWAHEAILHRDQLRYFS